MAKEEAGAGALPATVSAVHTARIQLRVPVQGELSRCLSILLPGSGGRGGAVRARSSWGRGETLRLGTKASSGDPGALEAGSLPYRKR